MPAHTRPNLEDAGPEGADARARRGPSRGPLSTLASLVAWCALLAAAGLLGAWLVGRIATDRLYATQFVFWVPSWLTLGAALLLTLSALLAQTLASALSASAGRPRRALRVPLARRLARLTLVGVLLALAWMTIVDHRQWSRLVPTNVAPSSAQSALAFRLVHWNLEAPDSRDFDADLASLVPGPRPALVLLSGYQSDAQIARSLDSWSDDARPYRLARAHRFSVASRWTVLRRELIALPSAPVPSSRIDAALQRAWDALATTIGAAPRRLASAGSSSLLWAIELDTREDLGRNLVVWFIDLTSDPASPRWASAQRARARLDDLAATPSAGTQANAVPLLALAPDLIVGDFNTPRASASLDLLTGGLTHAFDQSGTGPSASWPRGFPLLHIDHTFVGPGARATGYALAKPPVSEHWLQVVDLRADTSVPPSAK